MKSASADDPTWLFCVGAQKAGTTWLYNYLLNHPEVHVPPIKEMHYFNALWDPKQKGFAKSRRQALAGVKRRGKPILRDNPGSSLTEETLESLVDMIDASDEDHSKYRRFMEAERTTEACIADITPDYAVMPAQCFRKMADAFPNAKFLFLMREPIDRMWSSLKMRAKRVSERREESVSPESLLHRVEWGEEPHVLERSEYQSTILKLNRILPKERRLYLFYEDLFTDDAMRALCDFLDVGFVPGDYAGQVRKGDDQGLCDETRARIARLVTKTLGFSQRYFGEKLPQSWTDAIAFTEQARMSQMSASAGGASRQERAEIHGLAVQYCEAIHFSRPEVFAQMCHDNFVMTGTTGTGGTQVWDKSGYIDRVAGRDAFPGTPSYEIKSVDLAGDDIARVHLHVDVPPRTFEDHLGFVRDGGQWKLMTKVFRTAAGPALDG